MGSSSLGRFARHNEQITLNAIQMRFGTQYLEVREERRAFKEDASGWISITSEALWDQ